MVALGYCLAAGDPVPYTCGIRGVLPLETVWTAVLTMFRIRTICCLFSCLLAAGVSRSVPAEVFHLTNGGTLEGKLVNTLSSPTPRYVIQTDYARIVLETSKVVRVEQKPDLVRQYEAALPSVPDTVEGHLAMAQKCAEMKLLEQRDYHLEQVLRLDTDHERARQLLGYVRDGESWRKVDLWMKQQGYVKLGGRWHIPQELEMERLRQQRAEEEIQWREKIQRWELAIMRGRSTAQQSLRELKSIEAYRATPALADRIAETRRPPSRDLRLLYIDLLGKIGGSVATQALMTRVMEDPDDLVRERSLEQLRRWRSSQAMHYFISKLSSKENPVVNRAGYALGQLGNAEAVLPLIDALVTTHQFQVGGGGNINAGFSGDGGVGLGAGGKPKIIRRDFMNRDVHAALSQLTPQGVNFAFNKDAWRNWYTRANTPQQVNLRRSP